MKKQFILLSVAAIGITLSTPAYSADTASHVLAMQKDPQKKLNSEYMEKSSLSNADFIKNLVKEKGQDAVVSIWRLGEGTEYKSGVKLQDLEQALPENTQFVVINHKNSHENTVFIVNKNDEIINSQEEYDDLFKDRNFLLDTGKTVHTSFNIVSNPNLRYLLAGGGLRLGGIQRLKTSGVQINSQDLHFSTDVVYLSKYTTLEKYKQNDEKLIELIKKAGINAEEDSDEEKVKKWIIYVLNTFPYDSQADDSNQYADYLKASDIFSITEHRLAMCLGFSVTTARALNLMGIPAYQVQGQLGLNNRSSGSHAATRAYFGKKWHTIDTTSDWYSGEKHQAYNDQNYSERIDRYNLLDSSQRGASSSASNPQGFMTINAEFENWAKKQDTKTLLYLNSEVALKNRVPHMISEELKQNLIARRQELVKALKTVADATYDSSNEWRGQKAKSFLETLLTKDIQNEELDLEDYERYNDVFDSVYPYYGQLTTDKALSQKLEPLKQQAKILHELEELKQNPNRLSQEELAKKTAELQAQKAKAEQSEADRLAQAVAQQQAEEEAQKAAQKEQEEKQAREQAEQERQQAELTAAKEKEEQEKATQAAAAQPEIESEPQQVESEGTVQEGATDSQATLQAQAEEAERAAQEAAEKANATQAEAAQPQSELPAQQEESEGSVQDETTDSQTTMPVQPSDQEAAGQAAGEETSIAQTELLQQQADLQAQTAEAERAAQEAAEKASTAQAELAQKQAESERLAQEATEKANVVQEESTQPESELLTQQVESEGSVQGETTDSQDGMPAQPSEHGVAGQSASEEASATQEGAAQLQAQEANEEKTHTAEAKTEVAEQTLAQRKQKENVTKTLWADGVHVDEGDFKSSTEGYGTDYFATEHGKGRGYYDINKKFDGSDDVLCSGVVAANQLHWWLDRNKDYVERYRKQSADNGILVGKDILKLNTTHEDQSDFFDFIKYSFSNKPLYPERLLNMYINGYGYLSSQNPNVLPTSKTNFFQKVFKNNLLTENFPVNSIDSLSSQIKNALQNHKVLALSFVSYRNSGWGHVVTVWGADFDANGKVVAVYVTDSDDRSTTIGDTKVGMKRLKIDESQNDSSIIKLTGFEDENSGGSLRNLYTLSTGEELWKKYFEETEKTDEKKPETLDSSMADSKNTPDKKSETGKNVDSTETPVTPKMEKQGNQETKAPEAKTLDTAEESKGAAEKKETKPSSPALSKSGNGNMMGDSKTTPDKNSESSKNADSSSAPTTPQSEDKGSMKQEHSATSKGLEEKSIKEERGDQKEINQKREELSDQQSASTKQTKSTSNQANQAQNHLPKTNVINNPLLQLLGTVQLVFALLLKLVHRKSNS
ncbi:IdeS/Mac family cysteine endopeptidase [Streptococcus merionis]|uniref:IdeS/Mac family cysteine endopeptidase n=1 Tax=Streptococcus merionis TaxID=400065 RepID=UPI003516C688